MGVRIMSALGIGVALVAALTLLALAATWVLVRYPAID